MGNGEWGMGVALQLGVECLAEGLKEETHRCRSFQNLVRFRLRSEPQPCRQQDLCLQFGQRSLGHRQATKVILGGPSAIAFRDTRSDERRVGKECGSKCKSWWSPDN